MAIHSLRKTVFKEALPLSIGLIFLMVSLAMAAMPPEHANIVLRGPDGTPLTDGSTTAFSMKETCGACHGSGTGIMAYSYDDIEKHSFHAQLAANQIKGWNPWNPDSPDKFKKGPAAKGKNWVQSPGHVGKW